MRDRFYITTRERKKIRERNENYYVRLNKIATIHTCIVLFDTYQLLYSSMCYNNNNNINNNDIKTYMFLAILRIHIGVHE